MSELADALEQGFLAVGLIAVLTGLFTVMVHVVEQWRRR